jgi:hypothetical protein
MMARCYNPNDKDYSCVGAKGIKVQESWHDFEAFKKDMGERPEDSYLKRLDPRKDFTQDNIEWSLKVHSRQNELYNIWRGIKSRCGYGAGTHFKKTYRDKEIEMHPAWLDFKVFEKDVGPRPSENHSIDRIDNNRGYTPDNVRWATPSEQSSNTASNVWLEYRGVRKTIAQWAEDLGMAHSVFSKRVEKIFDPVEPRKQKVQQLTMEGSVLGEFENVKEASQKTGVGRAALQQCLCGGNQSSGGFRWKYV